MPTLDVYTQIFKEFFGQSEIVIFFILTVLIFFFVKLYNRDNKTNLEVNPNIEKQVFSFLVLFCWIIVALLIPLISSYINLPMLISRYFINILPAIILLIAIGIYYIKNDTVKIMILSIIFIFSITDIIIVKKYYIAPNKTQFREASQFIIDNNSLKEEVVSSLGVYLPYFLNNENQKFTIVDKELNAYINDMNQGISKLKSFWYFDGHSRAYNPSEEAKTYINQHFIVDKNIDLFDCYAKHFIRKEDYKPNVDISNFFPLQEVNGDKINFSVEFFDEKVDKISLTGWAYFDEQGMENAKIDIIAIKDNTTKLFPVESIKRDDVTTYFKSSFNLSNSGFKAEMLKSDFGKGNYQIGILIQDFKTHRKGLVLAKNKFSI
jgi:hypothetical protein